MFRVFFIKSGEAKESGKVWSSAWFLLLWRVQAGPGQASLRDHSCNKRQYLLLEDNSKTNNPWHEPIPWTETRIQKYLDNEFELKQNKCDVINRQTFKLYLKAPTKITPFSKPVWWSTKAKQLYLHPGLPDWKTRPKRSSQAAPMWLKEPQYKCPLPVLGLLHKRDQTVSGRN